MRLEASSTKRTSKEREKKGFAIIGSRGLRENSENQLRSFFIKMQKKKKVSLKKKKNKKTKKKKQRGQGRSFSH